MQKFKIAALIALPAVLGSLIVGVQGSAATMRPAGDRSGVHTQVASQRSTSPGCAPDAVFISQASSDEQTPQKSGQYEDTSIPWLTADSVQTAINKFWATISADDPRLVGASVDFGLKQFVVVVGPMTEHGDISEATSRLGSEIDVQLLEACRSKAELETILKRVQERMVNSGISHGLEIGEMNSSVIVDVSSRESAMTVQKILADLTDPIEIRISSDVAVPLARCGDASPHYGGAIFNGGGGCTGACTSGFKVRRVSDGQVGMSTAGHCRALTP